MARVYVDRFGRVVFHGRKARFDPETVAASASNWDFVRWAAATRDAVGTDIAQIREFGFNRPRERVINSYHAWPRWDERGFEFPQTSVAALMSQDSTSQAAFGYRGKEAPALIIKENVNNSNTGAQECALFGDFYTSNYAVVRKAIQHVTFKSIRPDDDRAAAVWDLMTRVDVSDAINLTVSEAGLSDEPFFVDGLSVTCRPAGPIQDYVEVTPNLTPASYYGTDVFA